MFFFSEESIASIFSYKEYANQEINIKQIGYFLGLVVDAEDRGNMFLRNVC
jgi:hypothetical protein